MRYRSSSVYNQLLIAHIMSKIIFMRYLPPVRPKMVPKLKMLRIYWNLTHVIFRIPQSRFWCQKLFLLNIYHQIFTQIGPKIKSTLNLLKFGTFSIVEPPQPPSLRNGGRGGGVLKFFKNGYNGMDEKFLLEMGGKPGMEVVFIMVGMGNFSSLFT